MTKHLKLDWEIPDIYWQSREISRPIVQWLGRRRLRHYRWINLELTSLPWVFSSSSHHLSLNREGRWGTTDDFATSFLHFPLFPTASGTCRTPGLSISWRCLPPSSVCLVFPPLSPHFHGLYSSLELCCEDPWFASIQEDGCDKGMHQSYLGAERNTPVIPEKYSCHSKQEGQEYFSHECF